MRELRVKTGDEAAAAASEVQDLREKIKRTQAVEIPVAPQMLRASFAEAELRSPEGLRREPGRFSREAETLPPAAGFWEDDPHHPQTSEPGILSIEAQKEAGNAFNRLAHALLNRPAAGRSVEDMTHELLRGMLKHWLDTNLPPLVERLVREEIERVARCGR
jgi:cell pole-organizing protein PopZ